MAVGSVLKMVICWVGLKAPPWVASSAAKTAVSTVVETEQLSVGYSEMRKAGSTAVVTAAGMVEH